MSIWFDSSGKILKMKLYKGFFKRVVDVSAAGGALLVLSIPLVAVSVWLHFANKGSGAFFYQERPGKDGKIFKVVKFKTMTDERDQYGDLLPDEKRLTKVGKFVRSTSIDELPQLWNVLKGDMSLIGPRPLLVCYLPLYSEYHARRHEVRPGITGWAQVHGRNLCKLSEKFNYDVWYVDNITFKTDWIILLKTIAKVFKRSDIGAGAANMQDIDDLHFLDRMK